MLTIKAVVERKQKEVDQLNQLIPTVDFGPAKLLLKVIRISKHTCHNFHKIGR